MKNILYQNVVIRGTANLGPKLGPLISFSVVVNKKGVNKRWSNLAAKEEFWQHFAGGTGNFEKSSIFANFVVQSRDYQVPGLSTIITNIKYCQPIITNNHLTQP